jgi:hypothetical protein
MFESDSHFVFTLTDSLGNIEIADWSVTSAELGIAPKVPFSILKRTLHGGRQEGSTTITVTAGDLTLTIVPTRGMGILRASLGATTLGWVSPVDEVVHPSFVNLNERGGLGWLEGFNELMARCGFEWTGHPVTDEPIRYTLHGRTANTPASKVVVAVERQAPHRITVAGLLKEKAFKQADFETWASLSLVPGEARFSIADKLTNLCDYDRPYEILYHTNFGAPLLGAGARFIGALEHIAPMAPSDKEKPSAYATYAGPTRDFDEVVYLTRPFADASGMTAVGLVDPAGQHGVLMSFPVAELPCFSLWKNTDTPRQGYVTGLEPGSNYPYRRPLEEKAGRVKSVPSGGSVGFHIDFDLLADAAAVAKAEARVAAIQAGRRTEIHETPFFQPS